jgi:hypothetical protein
MPIHERLRVHELPTLRAYLRATLCNIHDEFTKRADLDTLARQLSASEP